VDNHGAERWSNETDWSFSIDITDWYVDQSRPTSGSGTSWDEAFRTINEAVGKLTSSDTVHIANGTYSEQINLTSSHSGTASDRTVFINKEGDTNVIVDGATYGFYLNNADYVEIHGLKITSSSYGIYLYNNADHNKVTNCEIYGNSVNGVFLHSSNGGYNEIDHNKVYSNPDGGIYSYGDQNNSFYRNQVYANSSYGFYIYNPLSYHVYNNTIYQNGTYGIYFYRNNILYPSKFRNNIIVGHTRGFRGVLASGLDTDYEDVWNNTTNYQGITAGPNSISLDPQFVNPAAYDFHLRPTSPCINRGDPDPFYNDPDGTRADIGALYFPFENPTDWYVDQSMPISGDGRSWATAFKTINEAVRVLDSGDTVHIANGTYHEQINLTSSHSGTAADHTLFINKEGDTNVVVEGSFFGFFFNNADYVDINGLKITDSFYGIYYYNDADHNRITNSEIYNNRFYGVKIHLSNGGYNEIDHNKIHDNRYGIAARSSTNNKFYRNQIYRNDRYGVYLFRPYNYRIYNNTIYENGRFGVFFSTQEDPTRLIQSRNNIVIGHTFGFYGFQVSAGLVTDYEDIWNNDINYRNIVPGPNSIAQDPLFINPGAYDFHLRPTSPCIDRGDPDPFYNDPDGTRADIGALWYGAP
jgi:parallel beta-helix repeat protein